MANEKRLIDANKIKYTEYRAGGGREYPENVVTEHEIEKMPTVDAVEVVRCKDCQKFLIDNTKMELHLCMKRPSFPVRVKMDDFCSYGERRTDG